MHERGAAGFHYRSYRRGHYRTIGEGTIGLSELSDYYRTTIGVYYRNYRTGAQHVWSGSHSLSGRVCMLACVPLRAESPRVWSCTIASVPRVVATKWPRVYVYGCVCAIASGDENLV